MNTESAADDSSRNVDPGMRDHVQRVLRGFEAANTAFEGSGVQLCRLIIMLEDPSEPLAHAGKNAGEWHCEVFRRLLEFLHAAHALTAQAAEMTALGAGVARPATSPLSSFMAEIRTCMKHRAVPRMTLVRFPPPAPKLRALHMEVAEMISWPHWSPASRHFLHQFQPELPVFTAVHDYQQTVRMWQQRTLRSFRARFAELLSGAPVLLPGLIHLR